MKKNKTIILFIISVFIITLLIIFTVVFLNKNTKTKKYIQNVSIENNKIDTSIINDVEFSKGKIEKNNDIYYITMTATNNTKKTIDMSNYRISFRNKNNEEIEWFRGTMIGEVLPGESVDFIVESNADLSELNNLYYEDFFTDN